MILLAYGAFGKNRHSITKAIAKDHTGGMARAWFTTRWFLNGVK